MPWKKRHALEDHRVGRAQHRISTRPRLKAGHKLRGMKGADRARQKGRLVWHPGKITEQVGLGRGWGECEEGGRTEFSTAKSVRCRKASAESGARL